MIQVKISVIVPVYNVEKYLNRCLDSIANQTYTNLEIILVNDGSTDSSPQICEQYLEDQRFQLLHKENAGLGMARNSGLEVATGDYVLFVDSDDYLEFDMIEVLYHDLLQAGADTCISGFTRVFSNRKKSFVNYFAGRKFEGEAILQEVLPRMFGKIGSKPDYLEMSVWKVLFSNKIIQEHQLRFPSEREFISEDIIFNTDYYPYAKCVIMSSNTGYCYYENDVSLTTTYKQNRFDLQVKLYHELIQRAGKLGILYLSKARIDDTLIAIARYSIKLENKFSKVNGKKNERENIKHICSNLTLQNCLKEQDKKCVPWQSRVINQLMFYRQVTLLHFIMELKNKFRL